MSELLLHRLGTDALHPQRTSPTPSSDSESTPQLSLLDLPLELQAQIVGMMMIHLQDLAYQERRDSPRALDNEETLDDQLPEAEARWYGRGIAALFLSCRG